MTDENVVDEGGESACFAHLVCPECGVVLDGADHAVACTLVDLTLAFDQVGRAEFSDRVAEPRLGAVGTDEAQRVPHTRH